MTVASLARLLVVADPAWKDLVRQELRRSRIADIELVDSYFPEIARLMGCAWVDDGARFADVTIAVSRMQAMLRDVGRDWSSNAAGSRNAATVLVVLPKGEQHSFGAMLAASQLRRQGASVRLEVGTPAEELGRLVQGRNFDCAMISVGCEERLDQCRQVVEALKQGSGGRLAVAVGGALLDRQVDIRSLTGADVVTRDPLKALDDVMVRPFRVMEAIG